MIKIEKTEVVGFEPAIRGMRNPMNSWNKSDSKYVDYDICPKYFQMGENDYDLMMKLFKAGTDHRKFMRMIVVYLDVTAPLYWWKEFDTYKVGTVANSCSTMHKIHDKEFTLDDFSHEHLDLIRVKPSYEINSKTYLFDLIQLLNWLRDKYNETKDKDYWWHIIQLLPSSYNQKRTLMLNYEVLANIYHSRKNHKLDEWRNFCKWIETLPYSELIIGDEEQTYEV